MSHQKTIEQHYRYYQRRAEFARLRGWILIFIAIILVGLSVYGYWQLLVETEQQLIYLYAGVCGTVSALPLLLAWQAYDVSDVFRKELAVDQVRLDIYHATTEAVAETLGQYLPGFKRLQTEVSLGEELSKNVGQVSARYVAFKQSLTTRLDNKELADAIKEMVRLGLEAESVAASNQEAIEFIERHTVPQEDNVTPIR